LLIARFWSNIHQVPSW